MPYYFNPVSKKFLFLEETPSEILGENYRPLEIVSLYNPVEFLPKTLRPDGSWVSVNRCNLRGGNPWWVVCFEDVEKRCFIWRDSEAEALAEAERFLTDLKWNPGSDPTVAQELRV